MKLSFIFFVLLVSILFISVGSAFVNNYQNISCQTSSGGSGSSFVNNYRSANCPGGSPGQNGSVGPPGPQGPQGIPGFNGTNGIDGTNGTNGSVGPPGPQGPQGIPGINGTNGIDGTNGTNGINGLNGTNGINGTFVGVLNETQFTNNGTFWSIDLSWLYSWTTNFFYTKAEVNNINQTLTDKINNLSTSENLSTVLMNGNNGGGIEMKAIPKMTSPDGEKWINLISGEIASDGGPVFTFLDNGVVNNAGILDGSGMYTTLDTSNSLADTSDGTSSIDWEHRLLEYSNSGFSGIVSNWSSGQLTNATGSPYLTSAPIVYNNWTTTSQVYILSNSTTIYFNETRLNNTINNRIPTTSFTNIAYTNNSNNFTVNQIFNKNVSVANYLTIGDIGGSCANTPSGGICHNISGTLIVF